MYIGERMNMSVRKGVRGLQTLTFILSYSETCVAIGMQQSSAWDGMGPEPETNRTFALRVRFGSTGHSKSRFGFGSVRSSFQNGGSGSVRIDSNRTEPLKFGSSSVGCNKNN